MLISVDKAKTLIDLSGWTDEKIEMKLKAVEQTIRAYTNNNFQNRGIRGEFAVENGELVGVTDGFAVGDTIQISESRFNNGLYVVESMDEETIVTDSTLLDDTGVLVTKVEYPADVVACCVNLMEWELANRGKVGIQSETLSRHSVTYYNMGASDQVMGYPISLLGCLKAYRKARC